MRYIRFLKTPRVVVEKNSSRKTVQCLITITSDLGDSFLPYDIQLSAELLSAKSRKEEECIRVWQSVQWTGGMRSLPISFPLPTSLESSKMLIRVGVESKSSADEWTKLLEPEYRGVVSAWSAEFTASKEAEKFVQRRFVLAPQSRVISIWEETGESIARHIWDAGVALANKLEGLQDNGSKMWGAFMPHGRKHPVGMCILELGTGCGIVSLSLTQVLSNMRFINLALTDLPEAREIVERNIEGMGFAKAKSNHAGMNTEDPKSVYFQELNWDEELPDEGNVLEMILAADCTYNPDSSPALVNTLRRLANKSPNVRIGIAMKTRHDSEAVFFDLMVDAGFVEKAKFQWQLPGDEGPGEEQAHMYVYQLSVRLQEEIRKARRNA